MAYESESLLIGGDPNDDQSSANLVAIGDWMRGQLAAPDDVDYFKFTLSAPGLLTLSFDGTDPKRSATSWKVDVLDANLDFVRTLVPTVPGNLTASVTADSRTITVSGLTTAVKAGDRFTTVIVNEVDSQIYTVVEATTLRGGSQTLTLDTDWTARTDTTIAFDPAQMLANGGLSSLKANISQAGTYYLMVTAAAFTDSNYALKLGFNSALEADLNNTKEQAVTENSRLVPDLSHQGRVSASDRDVWLLSTANGGTFKIDFAAGSADTSTPFNLQVQTWTRSNGIDVLTDVISRGQAVSGAVTGAKSIEIDNSANPGATTFVVTVTTSGLTGSAQGAYTLKTSGSELDINDHPLIQVGSYTSGRPDEVLDLITDDLFSVAVSAEKKVALSSFLSASDADGQPLTYQFFLDALGDSAASGDIVIEQADGSFSPYVDGGVMTEAELSKAYVRAGSTVGNLVLDAQAFDSSGRPDNSGSSAHVQLKIRVVSGEADVVLGDDGLLQLTEGAVAGDQFQESVTFKLTQAPVLGETVTLRLVDTNSQLILDKRVLTFTSGDFATEKTVNVRALNDGRVEGGHVANLQFTLTSDNADSSYAGLQLAPLVFALTDPTNTAATGSVQLSDASTQGEVLSADASGIADADGLGVFNYVWQRSLDDGDSWSVIADATAQDYTLARADVGAKVRAVVSFTDGQGNLETVASSASETVLSDGSAAGVTITRAQSLQLTEGVGIGAAGYQETLSFKLDDAPRAGETVTLELLDTDTQLVLDKTVLTFTSANYASEQLVQVRALKDGRLEGAHSAALGFRVSSNVVGSAYATVQIDALSLSLAEPANTAASGAVQLSDASTQGQVLSADASGIADADGLGVFNYVWQRSLDDGANWSVIAGATGQDYTLAPDDVGAKVRVRVSFTDGQGNSETRTSSASETVVLPNVAPVTADADALVLSKAGFEYRFKLADFPFEDGDAGDQLAFVKLIDLPTDSLLRYDGRTIEAAAEGFSIDRANLSKLSLTVPQGVVDGATLERLSFQVVDSRGGVSDTQVLTVLAGAVYLKPASGFVTKAFDSLTSTTEPSARMLSPVGLDMVLALASSQTSTWVDLQVDSSLNANGYWVQDPAGFWVNLAQEVSTDNGLTTLKVQIEDGRYDSSDATPGEFAQSGVIANMPLSVVGITPDTDTTEDGHWF